MTDRNPKQEPAERPEVVPLEDDSQQPRILVAEDEPDIRQFYSEVLGSAGYQVDTVTDGKEAWDALQTRTYALVITDRNMPRLSGADLFRIIRANGMMMPVILATGTLPLNDEGLFFDAVLAKPFLGSDLNEAVSKFIKSPQGL